MLGAIPAQTHIQPWARAGGVFSPPADIAKIPCFQSAKREGGRERGKEGRESGLASSLPPSSLLLNLFPASLEQWDGSPEE